MKPESGCILLCEIGGQFVNGFSARWNQTFDAFCFARSEDIPSTVSQRAWLHFVERVYMFGPISGDAGIL